MAMSAAGPHRRTRATRTRRSRAGGDAGATRRSAHSAGEEQHEREAHHRVKGQVDQGERGRAICRRDRVESDDLGVGTESDEEGVNVGKAKAEVDVTVVRRSRPGTRARRAPCG